MSETIRDDHNHPLAVVVGPEDSPEKEEEAAFVTDEEQPIQLGLMSYSRGDEAAAHTHPDRTRTVNRHQEVIHVIEGSLSVDVYDENRTLQGTISVQQGQTVVFLRGGRGWTAENDARILEVKQGPYQGEDDVVWF
jgi:quercetin dioxygenase-like cupin family protein